jgi:hypothetical protein
MNQLTNPSIMLPNPVIVKLVNSDHARLYVQTSLYSRSLNYKHFAGASAAYYRRLAVSIRPLFP